MAQFGSLNLTAGASPLPGTTHGKPMTPVLYDETEYKDNSGNPVQPIGVGTGTNYQLPTDSLRDAVHVAWRWLGCKIEMDVTVTPNPAVGGGSITIAGVLDIPINFEIGIQSTPTEDQAPPPNGWPKPYVYPGPDLTGGSSYPISRTWNSYENGPKDPLNPDPDPGFPGVAYPIAFYDDLIVTSGIDTFYLVPRVRVTMGVHTIYTKDKDSDGIARGNNKIIYWMDNFEVTLDWLFMESGDGDSDNDIDPIPIRFCDGPPATEDPPEDQIKLPQMATTLFDPEQPYIAQFDLGVSDGLAAHSPHFNTVKMRSYAIYSADPVDSSDTHVSASNAIEITAYYAKRKDI